MRTFTYLWMGCGAMLLCFWGSIVAAQDRHIFVVGGGVSFIETNSQSVSHGHAYLVSGEPGFVFGGVQDRRRNWKLNYLLLIKHNATATSTFERHDPDPTVSSASSDGKVRHFYFKEELRFDRASVGFAYKAQFDQTKDVLINEQMTVQGKLLDMAQGRVFIVDMTVDPVRCQQVNVKLPSSEQIDFLRSTDEQYQSFTKRWMAELAKDSEVVAKTFGRNR